MGWKLRRIATGSPAIISFEIPKDYQAEYAAMVIKKPEFWDVEIKPWRKKRSTGENSQNHRLNGHCMQIANETGNDFADVKMFVKRSAMKFGLPAKTKPDGSIVYSLTDGEPIPISEADMDTQQCAWCIECVNMLAGELGIVLRESEW